MQRRSISLLSATAIIFAAFPTIAEPAFTLDLATVSGGVRYGSENLDLGVGVRGGYTLSQSIYIGAVFDYWFGESEEQTVPGFPGGPGGGTVSASVSGWDLMGEVGYDFGVSPTVVIRPLGGIGVFHADGETCAPVIGCAEISESEAAGAAGGQLLVDLDGFNIGAELRILFADEVAVLVGGNVGAAF